MMHPRSLTSPSRSLSHSTVQRVAQTATALLLMLGLAVGGATVSPASAQQTSDPSAVAPNEGVPTETPHWTSNFDEQMAQKLKHEPNTRTTRLQVLISVAEEANDLSLSETIDALLHVIETDAKPQRRAMAIHALHRIRPNHVDVKQYRQTMAQLQDLMQTESSEQVRRAAAETLDSYAKHG